MGFPRVFDFDVMASGLPVIKTKDGKISDADLVLLASAVQELLTRFNGRVGHGSGQHGHSGNLDEQFLEYVAPGVANTAFEIPHGLGRIPIGAEVASIDREGVLYADDEGSWTPQRIRLKCSAADARIRIRVY